MQRSERRRDPAADHEALADAERARERKHGLRRLLVRRRWQHVAVGIDARVLDRLVHDAEIEQELAVAVADGMREPCGILPERIGIARARDQRTALRERANSLRGQYEATCSGRRSCEHNCDRDDTSSHAPTLTPE